MFCHFIAAQKCKSVCALSDVIVFDKTGGWWCMVTEQHIKFFSPLCITNISTLTLINTSKHFIHFKYGNFQFSSFKNPTCSLKNEIGMQQIFRTNAQILIYFENHDETVLSYEVQGMQQFWYNYRFIKNSSSKMFQETNSQLYHLS